MTTNLRVGARVRLAGHRDRPDTAVVVATGPCPEPRCPERAVKVRRDPGSFTAWYSDVGTWHLAQCEPVDDETDERVAQALRDIGDTPEGRSYAEQLLTEMRTRQEDPQQQHLPPRWPVTGVVG